MMLTQAEINHRFQSAVFLTEAGTYTPFVSTPGARPLCLFFQGGNHYMPLLPRHNVNTVDFTITHRFDAHQVLGLLDYVPPEQNIVVDETDLADD